MQIFSFVQREIPPCGTRESPAQIQSHQRAHQFLRGSGHGRSRRRRGEHGGRGPGVGRHQRAHAPGRAHLGPPRPRLPVRQRHPAVARSPPDVAVVGAVRRQPVRVRVLLRAPRRRAHLRRRPRHQRRHLRDHGGRGRVPRRARPPCSSGPRHRTYRPRRLGLHLLADHSSSLLAVPQIGQCWNRFVNPASDGGACVLVQCNDCQTASLLEEFIHMTVESLSTAFAAGEKARSKNVPRSILLTQIYHCK